MVPGSLAGGLLWKSGCGTIFICDLISVSDSVRFDAGESDGVRYCCDSKVWYWCAMRCASDRSSSDESLASESLFAAGK